MMNGIFRKNQNQSKSIKMKIKKLFPLVCLLLCMTGGANAQQRTKDLALQLLLPDMVTEVNFDQDELIEYLGVVVDSIDSLTIKIAEPQDLIFVLTFSTGSDPEFMIHSRPAMDKSQLDYYRMVLKKIPSLRSRLVSYPIVLMVSRNGGLKISKDPYEPVYIDPLEKEEIVFKNADLKEKSDLLRSWAVNVALPVLSHYQVIVDDQFAGVKSMGQLIQSTDFNLKQDINLLTDSNSNYWRAVVEMSPGNQLIPVSKVVMHISQGQFDYAKLYLSIIGFFYDEKTLAAYYLDEARWRLDLYNKQLNAEIEKGIDLHDKGNYDEALTHYEKLMLVAPYSAWLQYEYYYSGQHGKKDPDDRTWYEVKHKVYSCDPMYHMDVKASNGQEGYLLTRRMAMIDLFRDDNKLKEDIIEYADIAFDLQNHAVAAQLYWMIISGIPDDYYKDKNLLHYFLYCLDKLGDQFIKTNFEGDFEKAFIKIDASQKKEMEKSAIFKSFDNGD